MVDKMDKTTGILSNYPLSIPYFVSLQLISIFAHWDIYYGWWIKWIKL